MKTSKMPAGLRAYWNKKKKGKSTRKKTRRSAPRSAPKSTRRRRRSAPRPAAPKSTPRRRRGAGGGGKWLVPALVGLGAGLLLTGSASARPAV